MSTQNLDPLRDWIGKTETRADTVTAWPAAALSATLDRNDPAVAYQGGAFVRTGPFE